MDGEAEEGVDEGPGEDACEADGVLPRVGVLLGQGKGGGAEGLEGGAGGGEEGVEGEEGEGWPEVEDESDRERRDYFDAKRWV